MAPRLTAEEKRLRRRERTRLQAFLVNNGALVKEDLPAGVVAWTRRSRNGSPFSDRSVQRLIKAGTFTYRQTAYFLCENEAGVIYATDCV